MSHSSLCGSMKCRTSCSFPVLPRPITARRRRAHFPCGLLRFSSISCGTEDALRRSIQSQEIRKCIGSVALRRAEQIEEEPCWFCPRVNLEDRRFRQGYFNGSCADHRLLSVQQFNCRIAGVALDARRLLTRSWTRSTESALKSDTAKSSKSHFTQFEHRPVCLLQQTRA
jgi:hypothetical protein